MIKCDKNKWNIHDPDSVFTRDLTDLNEDSFQQDGNSIWPREDLIQMSHKLKNIIIDFGFYGDESTLEGNWTLYVINRDLDEPWEFPIEKKSFVNFQPGIDYLEDTIMKYS